MGITKSLPPVLSENNRQWWNKSPVRRGVSPVSRSKEKCHGVVLDWNREEKGVSWLEKKERGRTVYDQMRAEKELDKQKQQPGGLAATGGVRSQQPGQTTGDKGGDTRFYFDLQAARYQKVYRMCLIVEKKNTLEKMKSFRSLKKYGQFDFFDIPFFAENEAFAIKEGMLDLDELKTEEEQKQDAWYLSVFQFITYKTYQRVRIALMKLIKNKSERRVAQIAEYFKKFKRIGARRVLSIYRECNHTKVKSEVMNQWKRFVRVVEIEEAMKKNDQIRQNFEAKIINERKQLLEAAKNKELEKKERLERLSGVKVKNGVLINTFVQSLERVAKENFGMLRQSANTGDFGAFTKLVVKGSIEMYQLALQQLADKNEAEETEVLLDNKLKVKVSEFSKMAALAKAAAKPDT